LIRDRGVAFDDRPFHPHLTLGRWRESRSSDRVIALAAAVKGEMARIHVDRATLYQSRPSSAGPTYTPLAHATLIGRDCL
jgi:2'-5' RNA ligase